MAVYCKVTVISTLPIKVLFVVLVRFHFEAAIDLSRRDAPNSVIDLCQGYVYILSNCA